MVDDPTKLHADGRRINVSQEHECRYWAEKFGVSPGELKAAVSKGRPDGRRRGPRTWKV
jgi:Protein of unknown function (DUF3606)